MREILFRGKRVDNGEWVSSGNLIHFNEDNEYYIPATDAHCKCTHDSEDNIIEWNEVLFYKVIPETVGQYTGLKDENGVKIFEGDVVDIIPEIEEIGVIEWADGEAVFMINGDGWCATFDNYYPYDVEVIGNIHDNPELVERESHV